MKRAQQRGQANYSDTQLRAEGDITCQQTVWVINFFCHLRSHLCSWLVCGDKMTKNTDFYAMQQGVRG